MNQKKRQMQGGKLIKSELVIEEGLLLKRKKSKITLSSLFGESLRQLLYINVLVTSNTTFYSTKAGIDAETEEERNIRLADKLLR